MEAASSTRKAYAEIDAFIELLDDYYKQKLPVELREFFKKEKDSTYVKSINPSIPIKNQNLSKETLALIAYLNLNYWCEDESEKQRLFEIYTKNEEKYQENLNKAVNVKDVFEKSNLIEEREKKTATIGEFTENPTSMIESKKITIIEKIKNFLITKLNKKEKGK